MSRKLTISRAAMLLGTSRAALQRLVGSGALNASDGLLSTDDLLRLFPDLELESHGILEKVDHIREHAFGRRVRSHVLPSSEVLAQRLFAQSRELAEVRAHLQAYHRLVADALTLADTSPDVAALRELLANGLAAVLGRDSASVLEVMDDMARVVSATVVVRPSGHEFQLSGNDSLLDAGLKSGIGLAYGCGSGNCGLCKARVVSGEVRRIKPTDYSLSEAERAQGHLLMCAFTAQTDLVLEAIEADGPADIPQQEIVTRVRRIETAGPNTIELHVQTPRSDRLRFLAGQSIWLGVATTDADVSGLLSLANCPCDDRDLVFHVARESDDDLSRLVFAGALSRNDEITVRGPEGDFVLPPQCAQPLLFIAIDTGYAPVKSLVEHALAAEWSDRIRLWRVATRADGNYLDKACIAWADALDEFDYDGRCADDAAAATTDIMARLMAQGESLADTRVFVAGPTLLLETIASAVESGTIRVAGWHALPV